MKNTIILLLLTGLMTACGASESGPAAAPTLGPTAEAWNANEVEAEADLASEAGASAGERVTRCTEVDPHPLGVSIAETFDVTYEQVMRWFCSGHPFDEILIAVQTSGMSDRSAEELLAMRQNKSWDQIWMDLGIVGP